MAFLGTAILAKATSLDVDVYSVKAGAHTAGAYSARGLGHGVLVPNALQIGIDLGVSGREPLNNQPYFRVQRATRETLTPLVRDRRLVDDLVAILDRLDKIDDASEGRKVLRAFIRVRREYVPKYPTAPLSDEAARILPRLASFAAEFVAEDSEGGRRAQAVAAGILSAVFGRELVESGRINDPDRHLPGDVGARQDPEGPCQLVFEVRDKPVSIGDLMLLVKKAALEGVSAPHAFASRRTNLRLPANQPASGR